MSDPARKPLRPREREVLWTTCLSHALIHVHELSVPALLWLIQTDFAADDFRMGQVVSLYGLLFGLGALPAGFLVDRLGSRGLVGTCLWGSSACVLGMALSPSLAWFSVSAAGMGLFLSLYHPSGTALITHSIPATGRVFALHGMAGNTGVAVASVLAGSLGALLGWRWAFGVLALLGFVLGVRAARLPEPTLHAADRREGEARWPALVFLLVAAGFMGMVYRGMTTFLPKLFATTFADDPHRGTALGGALTTASLLVGLAGIWVAGRLNDRGFRAATLFLFAAVAQAPFLVAFGFAAVPLLLPLAMGVAFFHFFTQPVGNRMVADFSPPHLRGLGYGLYFFLAFGAGSLGAGLGGWVSLRFGLDSVLPALALLLVPASLASLAILPALGPRRGAPGGASGRAAEPVE